MKSINKNGILTTLLIAVLFLTSKAYAIEQCFNSPGTFGNLTVTATASCTNTLNFRGINGLFLGGTSPMGGGGVDQSCTFTISSTNGSQVDLSTLNIQIGSHSNVLGTREEQAEFVIDGNRLSVVAANIMPPPIPPVPANAGNLVALASGLVGADSNLSAGIVDFSTTEAAGTPFSKLQINHTRVFGSTS